MLRYRLPLPHKPDKTPLPVELVLLLENMLDSPVTPRRDPLLARVLHYIEHGWPEQGDLEFRPFWSRRTELSVMDGCILWGNRVVIPATGQAKLLHELHEGHPGMSRMKSLARGFLCWPGMDNQIEEMVKGCTSCQQHQSAPPVAPLHPWKWPTRPWSRLHIDFAGPFLNQMFLVLIDAYSKWIEVFPMTSTTSEATIHKLRTVFAQFGLPETLVSDNGPNLVSAEFEEFLQRNGITHVTSSPYHLATKGLAERAV